MYFLSGDATCLKVIPAWAVMSVNEIFDGCVGAGDDSDKAISVRIRSKEYFKMIFVGRPSAAARLLNTTRNVNTGGHGGRPYKLVIGSCFFF